MIQTSRAAFSERLGTRAICLSASLFASCAFYLLMRVLFAIDSRPAFGVPELLFVVLAYSTCRVAIEGRRHRIVSRDPLTQQADTARRMLDWYGEAKSGHAGSYPPSALELSSMVAAAKLLPGLRHHVNDYLTIVLGHARLLRMSTTQQSELRALDAIERAASLAGAVLNRTITLVGLEQTEGQEPVSLKDLLAEIVEIAGDVARTRAEVTGRHVTVKTEVQDAIVFVRRTELRHAILNLVLNALDAMPFGGQLDVQSRLRDGSVTVVVGDTGVGVAEEARERIFEPFYTTKSTGAGLGLTIARQIVDRYDGKLQYATGPRGGTEFALTLPVARSDVRPRAEWRPQVLNRPQSAGGRPRLIVVDNERDALAAVAGNLELAGYEVKAFDHGEEALNEIRQHPGGVDVVLTDFAMPGLGGLEIAQRIKAMSPAIKVVLFSGWNVRSMFSEEELRARGIDYFLAKPIDPEKLVELVRSL